MDKDEGISIDAIRLTETEVQAKTAQQKEDTSKMDTSTDAKKEPNLSTKPWRKHFIGRDKKQIRDKLLAEITSYKPLDGLFPPDTRFPYVNILLMGAIGAGKSSTYNTIMSIVMNKIFAPARSGRADHSLTTKLTKYVVKNKDRQELNFKIWDMRGLEENHFMEASNMKYILQGNIPDKFQLDPSGEVSNTSPGFTNRAEIFETIHCVAVVMDSSVLATMDPSAGVAQNILQMQTVMNGLDVPVVGILTHVDKLCEDTSNDVSNVFNSRKVEQSVNTFSQMFGVPKHSIYPVKNYEEETELVVGVDVAALLTLKGILDHCDAFLVNRYKHIVDDASLDKAIEEENARLRKDNEGLRTSSSKLEEQILIIDAQTQQLSIMLKEDTSEFCRDIQSEIRAMDMQKADLELEIKKLNDEIAAALKKQEEDSLAEAVALLKVQSDHQEVTTCIPHEKHRKPITVQIYCKRNKLLTDIEKELTDVLTSRLKADDCDAVYRHIDNVNDVSTDNPMLVLCATTSRLGTDVDNAIHGLNPNTNTVLLIFHHKDIKSLPDEHSSRILTGEYFKKIKSVIDLAYLTDKGFYNCDLNSNGLDMTVKFIQNVA